MVFINKAVKGEGSKLEFEMEFILHTLNLLRDMY